MRRAVLLGLLAGCDVVFGVRHEPEADAPRTGDASDDAPPAVTPSELPFCAELVPALPPLVETGATTYYVLATGTGTTCTQAAPCPRIADALALAATRLDVVINIGDGTYPEQISLTNQHAGIVVRGWGSARPVIDATSKSHGVLLAGAARATVAGLEVANAELSGVKIDGANGSLVRDVIVHDSGNAGTGGDDAGITNDSADTVMERVVSYKNRGAGIRLTNASQRALVLDSVVRSNRIAGGLLVQGADHVIMRTRALYNEPVGIWVNGATMTLCHNITARNLRDGLRLQTGSGHAVLHHTSANNAEDGISVETPVDTLVNIITASNVSCGIRALLPTHDQMPGFRLYHANRQGSGCAVPVGVDDIVIDPAFVDPSTDNFWLRDDSPAHGRGKDDTSIGALLP